MIAAIVQARMGSTRLPGKVLMDICGYPMLWHVVNRVRQAQLLNAVLIASTTARKDDPIAAFCARERIPCYRGSRTDVLDRYYQAAKQLRADVIVRITADCPLIDPTVVDAVVEGYLEGNYDYVSNTDPPTFPDGLDSEVFSFAALERAWCEARLRSEREHVTPYIRKHPELFRIGNVAQERDLSGMRWTVDEPQDLEFVRAVQGYREGQSTDMVDVLDVLREHPELQKTDASIGRNEGYQKSVREDRQISGRKPRCRPSGL